PAHGDGRAALPGGCLPRFDATADHPQPCRGAAVDRRLELEARDRRDRGKRLTAEAEGADADQIRRAADLTGGVALQGKARVVGASTTATARERCCRSMRPSPAATNATTASAAGQRARRRASTSPQASHHATVAASHHSAGVAGPTANRDSLAASGGGSKRR